MGLSAGPVERRAENYANGNGDAINRKPLVLFISAAIASVAGAGFIVAGAAVLNYKPVQQHVEIDITQSVRAGDR
jgi:hypothetical protein